MKTQQSQKDEQPSLENICMKNGQAEDAPKCFWNVKLEQPRLLVIHPLESQQLPVIVDERTIKPSSCDAQLRLEFDKRNKEVHASKLDQLILSQEANALRLWLWHTSFLVDAQMAQLAQYH